MNIPDYKIDRIAYNRYRYQLKQLAKAGRKKPSYCESCKKFMRRLVFDHSHKTGRFRGWICNDCNIALGVVKDSISTLRHLIRYLQKVPR